MPLQRSERHVTLFRKQLGAGAGPATDQISGSAYCLLDLVPLTTTSRLNGWYKPLCRHTQLYVRS